MSGVIACIIACLYTAAVLAVIETRKPKRVGMGVGQMLRLASFLLVLAVAITRTYMIINRNYNDDVGIGSWSVAMFLLVNATNQLRYAFRSNNVPLDIR